MKKVLLIGDSTRQGYDKYVKQALADSCEVYYPQENCRFAQFVLRHLSDWKKELNLGDDVDAVHLYTPEGTRIITSAVLRSLCSVLALDPVEFTLSDYQAIKNVLGH